MKTIYSIAKECQDYIERNISFNRNKIPYGRLMFTDYDIVGNIKQLERLLIDFHSAIKGKYPSIATSLKKNMDLYDDDPIIHISAITAIVDCICAIEQPLNGKRIFISHSSKDAQIVSNFMDHILCLGIGINRNDIFCTSIDDVAIRNGEDIRKHIQDNIRCADYSFLLISDNYKTSEICLNEMGAVWAYDSNVRLYLLPDTNFNSIGWLCDTRKANKITDSVALDLLYKEIHEFYSLSDNFINWSQQRETFINRLITGTIDTIPKQEVSTSTIRRIGVNATNSNNKEEILIDYIKGNPRASQNEIAENTGLSRISVNKIISSLINKGIIEREGTTHNFQWRLKN